MVTDVSNRIAPSLTATATTLMAMSQLFVSLVERKESIVKGAWTVHEQSLIAGVRVVVGTNLGHLGVWGWGTDIRTHYQCHNHLQITLLRR